MNCITIARGFGALFLFSSALEYANALTVMTDWTQGQASFYGGQPDGMNPSQPSYGTKDGSCGYGVLNSNQYPYWSVGALATANSYFKGGPAQGCGMCFEVQCTENGPLGDKPGSCNPDPNGRSIVIQITDQCPECSQTQIDMQALTWAKIAKPSPSGGRINIQFRRVQCAPPTSIAIKVDANSGNDGWLRLQITTAGGSAGISRVQIKSTSTGNWMDMQNAWGASWQISTAPSYPVDIIITSDDGSQVMAHSVIKNGQTGSLPTSVQFQIDTPSDVQPSGYTLPNNGNK